MWQKIIDFFITFGVWAVFLHIPVHGLGHHIATWLQGGTTKIEYLGFWAEFAVIEGLSGGAFQLAYFSGGLIVALAAGLLWWRARKSPTLWDLDDEVTLACLGGLHLLYGLAEGVTLGATPQMVQQFNILAPIAMAVGFMVPLFLYIPRIARWLREA